MEVSTPSAARTARRSPGLIAIALTALLALIAMLSLPGAVRAQTVSTFATAPTFNVAGLALAVFSGGSAEALEAAAEDFGASGVWAQDTKGNYHLLVIGGPTFLVAAFREAFPDGFLQAIAVTLVRTSNTEPVTPLPLPPPSGGFVGTIAAQAIVESNAIRAAHGRAALERDSLLDAIAYAYAQLLFVIDPGLSSSTPHSLDGEPWDRATRAGYQWSGIAENIGVITYPSSTPEPETVGVAMAEMWLDSPPHRVALLSSDYTETGIGCVSGRPATPIRGTTPDLAVLCVAMYALPR